MTDRRFKMILLLRNTEALPGEFEPELARLDALLADELRCVDAPEGGAGRTFAASASHLEAPASLPFRSAPVVVVRQRRTVWARVAVAASLAMLVTLAGRVVMERGTTPGMPHEPEAMQASVSAPLPDEVEMLLLDRAPDRRGEEIAYLLDPDPRESSDMSLYVQTRDVTLDDVSTELALLETELHM